MGGMRDMRNDKRTTLAGMIVGAAMMVKAMGIDVPQNVIDGVLAIALFAMGFFAKDKR
jgi:hypothetical protein